MKHSFVIRRVEVPMRLYYEIALRSFRRATAYRSAYIAGMLTNAFFGALRCFVYIALYGAGGSVAGFTLVDAISYTWITQSLISIGAGWVDSRDMMQTIRSGDVVADLMRPWSFFGYWLSRTLGERIFNLLVRGSLTYLIGVLYFHAHVPTLAEALGFAISISLALLVSFGLQFLVNLTAFWLIDNTGVLMITNVVHQFFSGFLLPLAFFPLPLATVAGLLPFQAITGLPAQIFLGQISGAELPQTLLLQLFWALVLCGLAWLALWAAMRKVVIQGG
jgi:ABC-2 type transport system permease protein